MPVDVPDTARGNLIRGKGRPESRGPDAAMNNKKNGKNAPGPDGRPGILVVVEGIDGTGKTTLARNLYATLRDMGHEAIFTCEPTDGKWGRLLRSSFSAAERLSPSEELDLFIRDRQDHVERVLSPALSRRCYVICDRYYFSTMAYQGARGLDPREIRSANEAFAPVPDLVLLMDLDPELALKRIIEERGDRPNNFEQLAVLKKVDAIFVSLSDPFIVRLDATLSPEELLKLSLELVLKTGGKEGERNV